MPRSSCCSVMTVSWRYDGGVSPLDGGLAGGEAAGAWRGAAGALWRRAGAVPGAMIMVMARPSGSTSRSICPTSLRVPARS